MYYGTQKGNGPANAKIMIVGEAWGREEKVAKRGFVGASGKKLREVMRIAGMQPQNCYITNVLNFQPPGNNIHLHLSIQDDWISDIAYREIERLTKEIEEVNPNIIIALGRFSAWVLTGVTHARKEGLTHAITSSRGSIYRCNLTGREDGKKVITLHWTAPRLSLFLRGPIGICILESTSSPLPLIRLWNISQYVSLKHTVMILRSEAHK